MEGLCLNGDKIGSSSSRWGVSWTQLLLASVVSGLELCRSRGDGMLLALRKECIDCSLCSICVDVAVDEGVVFAVIGVIGGGIVGCECLSFVEFRAS